MPRVITITVGARHADGINLAVGADPDRIRWALRIARQALEECGRSEAASIGAYVSVVVDEDLDRARNLVAGEVASFARFSVMHGHAVAPNSTADTQTLEELHRCYDMNHHFQHDSPQSRTLPPEFIDRYAIIGSPVYCSERLAELLTLGISRFLVSTTPGGVACPLTAKLRSRFAKEVLPRF